MKLVKELPAAATNCADQDAKQSRPGGPAMPKIRVKSLLLLPLLVATACANSDGRQPGTQPVVGKLVQQSFAGPVTSVRAQRAGAPAIVASVAPDGGFTLVLGAGRGYHIDFLRAGAGARLVLPRQAGALAWSFDVRGGGASFDLGAVRYLGSPTGQTFAFTPATTVRTAALASAASEMDSVACEDGKDASGAVCVDDQEGEQDKCGEGSTGAGGSAFQTEADDSAPEAAVAEHNVPSAIGCADEGEGEGDNGKGETEGDD
jgi:hypothetical protein